MRRSRGPSVATSCSTPVAATMTQKIAAASTKRTESSVPTVAPSSYASLPKIAKAPKQAAEAMHMAKVEMK